MFKQRTDCKCRFRILKGGKISLVVSALVLGIGSTTSQAIMIPDDIIIDDSNTTAILFDGNIQSVLVTANGDLNITNNYYVIRTNNQIAVDQNVTNQGTITSNRSGDGEAGMAMSISNNAGKIINDGNVEIITTGTGKSSADGIYINSDNSGTVTNNGSINLNGESGVGIYVGSNQAGIITVGDNGTITVDANSTSYGIKVSHNTNTIENNGTISVTSLSDDNAYGIHTVDSSGSIVNNGAITSNYKGIHINDGNSGTIRSTGSITVTSESSAYGIEVTNNHDTIVNDGNIETETTNVTGIAYGIKVSTNVAAATIRNDGNITVTPVTPGYGRGIDVSVNQGNVVNNGIINVINKEDRAVNINGSTGTFLNDTDGIINGNIDIDSTGLATNRGTINLKDDVTSRIGGDFNQTSSAILSVDATITGAAAVTHSKLSVTGTVTLADGSTIDVDVSGTDGDIRAFASAGSQLSDIISAGTLDVNASSLNITDNSALLNFTAIKDGNTLDLNATQGATIEDAVIAVGENPQFGQAAVVLDTLGVGGSGEIGTFITYLNTLPTNEAVTNAVAQVTPTTTSQMSMVGTQLVNTMSTVVQARQSSVRGFGSGDIAFSDKNMWFKPFGGYTKQDDIDGISGFSADTFGLGFGIDAEYKTGYRAGIAFFYTKADVQTNSINQESDLDVFNVTGYGSNPIIDDKTNLFYQASFGIQKTDTSRVITGIATANADFDAKSFYIQLKATRDIAINDFFNVKPAIVTSYTYYKNPSYSENGAGALNLDVKSFNSDSFVLGIESDFYYEIDSCTKLISNLALSYDFNNEAQTVNSSFQGGGVAFSTRGIENEALIYKAGIGLAKKLKQNLYLDMKYDLDGRGSEYFNHVVSAKFNYKF